MVDAELACLEGWLLVDSPVVAAAESAIGAVASPAAIAEASSRQADREGGLFLGRSLVRSIFG